MAGDEPKRYVVQSWVPLQLPTGERYVRDSHGTIWHVHGPGSQPYDGTGSDVRHLYSDGSIRK
jgi:hypothetical protein